jgi:hypothetical protein
VQCLHYESSAREQPTSQDEVALQKELEHLQDLQSTRAVLRAQIEESIKRTLARSGAPASSHPELMPWNKVGRATPAATVETVFWSIAQGDVETLATLIAFDDDAQDQAERFYEVLPEDLRKEYDSPERLVAALMAIEKPVTLKSVNVLGETSSSPDRGTLQLSSPSGNISLDFQRDAGGWKLVVPALIVDGYRHYAIGTLSLLEPMPGVYQGE